MIKCTTYWCELLIDQCASQCRNRVVVTPSPFNLCTNRRLCFVFLQAYWVFAYLHVVFSSANTVYRRQTRLSRHHMVSVPPKIRTHFGVVYCTNHTVSLFFCQRSTKPLQIGSHLHARNRFIFSSNE